MKKLIIIGVILLSLGTILPLFQSGFFTFHDNTTVVRVYEMSNSLLHGMFPVRWVENLGYGYGYPIFNFYGPFPYYFGGLINLIGFDSLLATKVMLIVGMLAAPITMFLLSRKLFGNSAGVVSAIVYAYFPYHALNLYVRGAVGEIFAYAFLPMILLGLFMLFSEKSKSFFRSFPAILVLAFGIFLVAISHNLTLLMLFIILPFVIIAITFFAQDKKRFLLFVVGGIVLGIALSSFYVIPAFLEMGYTNVSSQLGGGAYFADHYVCISQFWESQWGFGGSVPGCLDGLSFKLGKINLALLLLGVLLLGYRFTKHRFEKHEKATIVALVILTLASFFCLSISGPVWENFPLMAYIQYPWRFINFIALAIAIISGYGTTYIVIKSSQNIRLLVVVAICCLTILLNLKLFNPQEYTSFDSSYYTNQSYIRYTASKISDEYMPKDFNKPKNIEDLPSSKLEILVGTGYIAEVPKKTMGTRIKYKFLTNGILHINQAFFPAWHATINGKTGIITQAPRGMDINVQKGEGIIDISFRQTTIEKVGNVLSILAFFAILLGIMLPKSYGKKTS